MRRVMIIGQPGSGKSTLARQVAEIAHLPLIHADQLHWTAGWIERHQTEKIPLFTEAAQRPAWVFEGNHSRTAQHRVDRADTVIWIDLPVGLRLWRIGKRILRWYGRTRPDLPAGCPEQLSAEFLRYVWTTRGTGRQSCLDAMALTRPGQAVHHLRSRRQVAGYLAALRKAAARGNLGISHR
ncbi:MAG: AAA family ATPase [Pseudomonadota bacterium]